MLLPDYIVIVLYFIVLILLSFFTFSSKWKNIFGTEKKTPWWIGGLSIFMIFTSIDSPQLYSGIIHKQGIWGLWLLWVGGISAGVVPIIFAPLWAKLNFITDNQFILFRFSGIGAKILHRFRAIYVGGLIVAFLLSFQVLAFSRVLMYYMEVNSSIALLISGGLLLIFSLKNTLSHKLKTDVLHAVIYFASFIICIIFIVDKAGGWSGVIQSAQVYFPEKLVIIPSAKDSSFLNTLLVYVTVLWWSAQMFDGGGQEAQRFFSTRDRYQAIKAGLIAIIFRQASSILIIIVIIAGMTLETNSVTSLTRTEGAFVGYFYHHLPSGWKGLGLLGFFVAFISTAESLLNWGSSFLMVDVYKKIIRNRTNRHYANMSFVIMFSLSLTGLLIAFLGNTLYDLIQILFSISAGVAPVFILRWIWLRINAWSQLSAMLASVLFTLIFDLFSIDSFLDYLQLDIYALRILFVTFFTTVTWLLVTFLTPKDDEIKLAEFRKLIPLNSFSLQKILLALGVGVGFTASLALIVYVLINW